MQVRLAGEGDVGRNGGPPGNLYIQVNVQDHPVFTREEYDLIYRLPINMVEGALGVEKEVPTLDGPTALKIPPGTQPGTEFRIKGKGVPHLQSNRRGDLVVEVDLQVPRNLDSRQRKLLEELARSFGQNGRAEPDDSEDRDPDDDSGKEKGLFDRIKDAFG